MVVTTVGQFTFLGDDKMCECYQIGGRFIAEDPNCPVHGYQAQREQEQRRERKEQLLRRVAEATTIEELRECVYDALDIIDD